MLKQQEISNRAKKIIISSASIIMLASPALILAFNPGSVPTSLSSLSVNALVDLLFSILWPVAVAFFIVMFVLAGFLFATARGDAEQVKKARDAVIYGAVGVVVALLAFSVVFVLRNIVGV